MHPVDEPGAYAGVVSRGVAFFVDAIIVIVLVVGANLVAGVFTRVLDIHADVPGGSATAYAALPIVFIAYCALFWSLLGRTPGMALIGIRVVRMNGEKPGVVRSFVRAACYALSAVLLVGFAWSLVDRRRQGFHDKLARTLVVYERGSRDPRAGS